MQYLVQMKLADSVRPKSPEETIAFIKQYVFPTLDVCDKLLEEKKIVAGGPLGGAIALAIVVRAESIQELDELLESLPVWPLMQTTVIPLTSFADRRDAGRRGWKAKYGGLEVSEAKRLQQLEEENRQPGT